MDPNDYEMVTKDMQALPREELKAFIDYWEDEAENSAHKKIQSIAISELKKRNINRAYQIKLLNKSFLASTRFER